MASILFQATPSLKKAAALINEVDSARFGKLLVRVVQKLHLKDEHAFSEEEEARLQSALELEARDLQLVLETSTFIMQQAAYHLAKPSSLQQHLLATGMTEEKAGVFVQVWSAHGKAVVERLRSRAFYPTQLEEVNWRLNLQMSQSTQSKVKQPNALLEFVLKDGEDKEKVKVEFTHQELYKFYKDLETIQGQIDSLT